MEARKKSDLSAPYPHRIQPPPPGMSRGDIRGGGGDEDNKDHVSFTLIWCVLFRIVVWMVWMVSCMVCMVCIDV